jgi:hypothetical protein
MSPTKPLSCQLSALRTYCQSAEREPPTEMAGKVSVTGRRVCEKMGRHAVPCGEVGNGVVLGERLTMGAGSEGHGRSQKDVEEHS